jgi:hypothetical protein
MFVKYKVMMKVKTNAGDHWQVPLSAGVLQQGTTEEKGENARMVGHRQVKGRKSWKIA